MTKEKQHTPDKSEATGYSFKLPGKVDGFTIPFGKIRPPKPRGNGFKGLVESEKKLKSDK